MDHDPAAEQKWADDPASEPRIAASEQPDAAASSRFSALREALFANGLPDLQKFGKRGKSADLLPPADTSPADPPPAGPALSEPCTAQELVAEAVAVARPPDLPAPRPSPRHIRPHSPADGLERGEPLDGIELLPSRPGQYRRKS